MAQEKTDKAQAATADKLDALTNDEFLERGQALDIPDCSYMRRNRSLPPSGQRADDA